MPHVPPLLRLTAYFYQLTIETRGLFHSPPPLMKCSNQVMAHRARRGKLPLATFVSQPGPPAIVDYNIRTLATDVAGIVPALGHDKFYLIGHDWGCVVAWNTALLHEKTCQAVMGLSVPFWRMAPETLNPPGMD